MSATDTPMFRQFTELKAQVPDALLFFRMGDFYELFFDDARLAAEALELTLTSRNKNDPDPIPMCGVPAHAADSYLRRLVDQGHKVAIAEQTEAEANGSGRVLMRRELVRVVSPGMPLDSASIEARETCFVAAVSGAGPVGLAFLDASTGDLRLTEVRDTTAAAAEVLRMEAREVVLDPRLGTDEALRQALAGLVLTTPDPSWFASEDARRSLCQLLGTQDLSGFGVDDLEAALGAAGAVVTYARETARVDLRPVRTIRPYLPDGHMVLDEATRRNLELLRPLRGTGRKGTLVSLLDRTCTPMGGRLVREWLSFPLVEPESIAGRLDGVDAMLDGPLRQGIRERLKAVSDLERLASKAAQGTANARDLVALATSLEALPGVVELCRAPALASQVPGDLCPDVAASIHGLLVDDPPTALTEGGLVRPGVDATLDELRDLSLEGKGAIARLEAKERARTGIVSLKIRHNKVFGYFLEVTQANFDRVPNDWIRKQTLSNCERFVTPELKEFEEKVQGADEKRKALEYEMFVSLRDEVARNVGRLQDLAHKVAWLDAIAGFADLARDRRYVRPTVDRGLGLHIEGGRHPVVEAMQQDERFVPNDLSLDEDARLIVLTGPNMAGKSTVMRQVALIALMAQVGCFVPADRAHVGICDRIFVRVGASDDLARGRSTFMVEMAETALILNQATSRSLVLLDEIGRGTSTYDGLAIAWAVAEAIHDQARCRALFATHYHELVALAEEKRHVRNLHVAVSEWGERIVFLRTLKAGGASKSYGIQCARLAGMPHAVVERARELLRELEKRPRYHSPMEQLALFPSEPPPPPADPVREALQAVDPDTLSPRDALELVYRLRGLAQP